MTETERWKRIAIRLANSQATTAERLLRDKATTEHEARRQKHLCTTSAAMLGGSLPPPDSYGIEDAIERCRHASQIVRP